MIKVQIYKFTVQSEKRIWPNKFKRLMLKILRLRPDQIDGYLAIYNIVLLVDGWETINAYNEGTLCDKAISYSKYLDRDEWNIISVSRSNLTIESKKPMRFRGFGDINDVGYLYLTKSEK